MTMQRNPAGTSSTVDMRRKRVVVDAVLVLVLLVAAVAEIIVPDPIQLDGTVESNWVHVVLVFAMILPLAGRRQWPITMTAMATGFWAVDRMLAFPSTIGQLAMAIGMYSIGRYSQRSIAARAGAVLAGLPLLFTLSAMIFVDLDLGVFNFILFAVFLIAPLLLGMELRRGREYQKELELRNTWLEASKEREAEQAVAAERVRIARELHDVVAHKMSVMVIQAEGARRILRAEPDRAAEALTNIEESGRDGLVEMRRLLGVLREEGEASSRHPQPRLSELEPLLEDMRDAGLNAQLTVEGIAQPLPAGLDLSAYRIVQEALTNSLKHAGPNATAEVRLRYEADALHIEVVDDGRGAVDALISANGAGQGLLGMKERAALFGSELHAGARTGGGYRIAVDLPITS